MSINQKSGRQTFRRRFVSGPLFVSPCRPECYLQSETKIEPDLTLESPDFRFPKVWEQEQYYIDLASAKSEAPINSNL